MLSQYWTIFAKFTSEFFDKIKAGEFYSQLRQNYLNKYFQAKADKELPKQFPEPLLVGKLDVGNFALSNPANTLQARNYLVQHFQGASSTSVFYYLTNC